MMWNNYNQQGYPFFNYPYNSSYNYNNSVAPMQQPAQMNNTTYGNNNYGHRPMYERGRSNNSSGYQYYDPMYYNQDELLIKKDMQRDMML